MAQQIQLRNDSTLAWEEENPILAQGEFGVDTTLGKFKIGNGTSTWSQLQFQTGDIADFVFSVDEDGSPSRMTVTDHDMTIQTVRENDGPGTDVDINIQAADDVFIRAYGDEIGLYAANELSIRTNNYKGDGTGDGPLYGSSQDWVFDKNGRLTFPDGTMQISAGKSLEPLEDFLTWEEQRGHLPELNTNFGWDSDGVWFTNAEGGGSSYPIFTNSTIPENVGVTVDFDVDINSECSDMGVAIYEAEALPVWDYDPNTTRIAAQFDCFNLELIGRTTKVTAGEGEGVPATGIYTVTFTYNPTAPTNKVTVSYKAQGSTETISTLSINEALPAGPYRIGFAADQGSSDVRTYMSNLSIVTTDEDIDVFDSLKSGDSTIIGGGSANLVVPTAIKDGDGDDFITFTRTGTGTARIATPQDDLSLRSARDITLFAGSEGPGNVYIGWGDAEYTPDSPNRVATIGDINDVHGDFEFNDNVMSTEDVNTKIQAKRDSLRQGAAIEFDPYDGHVALYGYTGGTTNSYSTGDWTGDATWSSWGEGGSQVVLTGATALVTFLNETFNQAPVKSLRINGSDYYEFDGFGGNSENVTLYTINGAPLEPTTVTSLEFRYQIRSVIEINEDNEEILIEGNDLAVQIRTTENKDIIIDSSDDLELKAKDEIRLYANTDSTEQRWSMGSDGRFNLPRQGYISNPVDSSGDGNNYDTIQIVPDGNLIEQQYHEDQYIIIDPTQPNHIHIRAGGIQDDSTADLFIGAERTHVRVSDSARGVEVKAKKDDTSWTYPNIDPAGGVVYVVDSETAEPDYNDFMIVDGIKYVITSVIRDLGNSYYETTPSFTFAYNENYTFTRDNGSHTWKFGDYGDATLILPSENPTIANNAVPGDITISAYLGVELGFADTEGAGLKFPDQTIQTTAYVPGGDAPTETSFTVNGGTLGTQPTFTGDPLFSGSYVKNGPQVHFQIQVDMDNILTFGTGQYYMELPFAAKYGYQFKGGCLHHVSNGNQYAIGGHVYAGSDQLLLTFTGSNGQDEVFDYNSPVTLAVGDNFHISGDYIASPAA
jgi:hypothetical protein